MGLDIRIPLGLLFLATGGIMSVYGFLTRGSAIYEKSLGVNLNLDSLRSIPHPIRDKTAKMMGHKARTSKDRSRFPSGTTTELNQPKTPSGAGLPYPHGNLR
jgi:hypothetical protein